MNRSAIPGSLASGSAWQPLRNPAAKNVNSLNMPNRTTRRRTAGFVQASQTQLPPPQRPQPSGRIGPNQQQGPGYQQFVQPQQQPLMPPPGQPNPGPPLPPSNPGKDFLNNYAKALIAGAFVCGLGVGVYYDSEVVLSPQNLSSTQLIDRVSPNSDVCMAYGYSSSVFDMKLYVTYNPFNVYVTQPVIKSGCVLRRANVGVLERENLVEKKDVDMCKQRMNTFAFTGDLKNAPEVSCVYHSEEAENQYMNMMMKGDMGLPKPPPSAGAAPS